MILTGKRPAEKITDNICLVDTGYLDREKFAASYFIADAGEVAIIETNTNHAVPGILDAVSEAGFNLCDIKYIVLTHIHLDHAGGAGLLMSRLPDALLVVHPRGARHMVSPEKLIESVKSVYGEKEYTALYGDIIPVPENRVIKVQDGEKLKLGNRELVFLNSPGHADHHHVVYDPSSGSVFTGDSFGIIYPLFSYPGGRLIFPSTSPVQFDPEKAIKTFEMIAGLSPERVLLTHFGSIENVNEVHSELKEWIEFIQKVSDERFSEGFRGDELAGKLTDDIWKRFDAKLSGLRGAPLSVKEREFLYLDADLNGKGAAFYVTRKNS